MISFTGLITRFVIVALGLVFATLGASAQDTTPPTLSITHSWIRKESGFFVFRMLLDPQDDKGIQRIEYREKINTTAIPSTTPWATAIQNGTNLYGTPWIVNRPFELVFNCTSLVVEFRAVDTSNNISSVVTRTFKSPFPLTNTPNLEPTVTLTTQIPGAQALECKGLFNADFDANGLEDVAVIDRTTGLVKVRRNMGNFSSSNGFGLTANTIEDSACADLTGDGKPDLAIAHGGGFTLYRNDGLNGSNVLAFSDFTPPSIAPLSSGLTAVHRVAAGDVSGDGRPDLILAGDADDGMGGTVARVVVFKANATGGFDAPPHGYTFPTGKEAGRMAIGDLNGDGFEDIVTISAVSRQLIVLLNKGGGFFGEFTDADTSKRPIQLTTGSSGLPNLPANAVAVGDVTGDGKADIVTVLHAYLPDNANPSLNKNVQLWQFFDQRQNGTLRRNPAELISESSTSVPEETYSSDVILRTLSGDRIPEMVFTRKYGAGIRMVRLVSFLSSLNEMAGYEFTTLDAATADNPHRLTARSLFEANGVELHCANGHTNQLTRLHIYPGSATISPLTLACGATTQSDPAGTMGTTGAYSYWEYVGGTATFTLAYANNTANNLTGVIIESTLPAQLEFVSADSDHTLVPGTTRYVRWTLDLPAGSSGVKQFTAKLISGTDNYQIKATGYLRSGTTTLTKAMPVIVAREPLQVTLTVLSDSDPTGARAHIEEIIRYTMKMKNRASSAHSGLEAVIVTPVNTTYFGHSLPDAQGAATPVGPGGRYTQMQWKNFTLGPNEERTVYVDVKVKNPLANGTIIKIATSGVKRLGAASVYVPNFPTRIDPPLEITLTSNKSIVQPGDIIRYTFNARNWLASPITSAKVVNKLPTGTALYTAAANDAVDAPTGNGNFIYSAGSWTAAQLSPTTLPAFDRSTGIMTWVLGTVPGGAQRSIEFDVVVAKDIPTFANISGVSTTLEIQNASYNFVATPPSGTRIFAGKPVGGTSANLAAATSDKLLSTVLIARRSLLSDPPLTPPLLTLTKEALGDGETTIAGAIVTTVINDTTISTDGLCDYKLTAVNQNGGGLARGVLVRDYVPTNMTFVGHVWRNGSPVGSFVGYRFYDAAGKEMQVIGAEGFTDTNGNGFYDVGEVYTDANGNRKYDGVTASLVRSMAFPAGDLISGDSVSFTYRTKTSAGPGIYVISYAGGMTGVKNGLDYTNVPGFHLTADDLHFPVNGSPKAVKVLITAPAQATFPVQVIKSRGSLADNEAITLSIPYEVQGAVGVALSGMKLETLIPKGYQVAVAQVLDTAGAVVQKYAPGALDNTFTIGTPDSTGARKLIFPLGGAKVAFPLLQLAVDPATKSVLKDSKGQTKAPLVLRPKLTGSYVKPSSPPPLGVAGSGTMAVPPPATPVPFASASTLVNIPVLTDTTKDSKIFVGRCAPVSVKRGDTFSYTIFVGNLTDSPLGTGIIEMEIPSGCEFVSASKYKYNAPTFSAGDIGVITRTTRKVSWNIGSFFAREGGAVTLTVKVREDFTGTRIDDNSCIFDTVNASGKTSGPLGVVVRAGNEITQAAEIVQSAGVGLGLKPDSNVIDTLRQSFTLNNASCFITSGGADAVQMKNGVLVIQMRGGRVMTVGPPDKIVASGSLLVKDDAMIRVACGPGDSNGVQVTKLPTLPVGLTQPVNVMLDNLHNAASSLVAAGAGNMVAAGAGNMVAAGAGNLIGQDGGSFTGPNAAKLVGNSGNTFTDIATLSAAGGGKLVGNNGNSMVAAGAGNMVAAGAGNMVAAGAGNLKPPSSPPPANGAVAEGQSFTIPPPSGSVIDQDGAGIISSGAGNLIGQDDGAVVTGGGNNIISTHTGNLINTNGVTLIPNK